MGLVSPVISSSQPLQEPASTSRIASARPKRRLIRCSSARPISMAAGSPACRISVAMPVFQIFENNSMQERLSAADEGDQVRDETRQSENDQLISNPPPRAGTRGKRWVGPDRLSDFPFLSIGLKLHARRALVSLLWRCVLGHFSAVPESGAHSVSDAPHVGVLSTSSACRSGGC